MSCLAGQQPINQAIGNKHLRPLSVPQKNMHTAFPLSIEEDDTQIIIITPGNKFYYPPPPTEWEFDTAFACHALAESKTPAQLFHEELELEQLSTRGMDSWRAPPDVPQDFDAVSCYYLEDMVEDLEDDDEDDSEEAITPLPQAVVFTSLDDKRLVAHYEDSKVLSFYVDCFLERLLHQDSD